MANFTIETSLFPDGTQLGVYRRKDIPHGWDRAPLASPVTTGVLTGNSITFNLTEDEEYAVGGQVGGEWRYIGVLVDFDPPVEKIVSIEGENLVDATELDLSLDALETSLQAEIDAPVPVKVLTDNYSLISNDRGSLVVVNSASGKTLTIPAGVFATGDTVSVLRAGGGTVTLQPGPGLTLKYPGGVATPTAIAHDASSSSTADTTNLSWTHTPVGTPKGAVVMVAQYATVDTTDQVSGVTYGGQAMTELQVVELSSSSDFGFLHLYFLANPPTGPQTVVVTVSGADMKRAVCATQIGDSVVVENSAQVVGQALNAQVSLTTGAGVETMAYGVIFSEQGAPANVTPDAGLTELLEYDFGLSLANFARLTNTDGGSNVILGWTQGSSTNWFAAVGVAVKSVGTTIPTISPLHGRAGIIFTSPTEAYVTGYLA